MNHQLTTWPPPRSAQNHHGLKPPRSPQPPPVPTLSDRPFSVNHPNLQLELLLSPRSNWSSNALPSTIIKQFVSRVSFHHQSYQDLLDLRSSTSTNLFINSKSTKISIILLRLKQAKREVGKEEKKLRFYLFFFGLTKRFKNGGLVLAEVKCSPSIEGVGAVLLSPAEKWE